MWEAQELPRVNLDGATQTRVAALTEDARRSLAEGRVTEAARTAEQALSLDPRAALARAVLGMTFLKPALEQSPPTLALLERAEGELRLARRLAPNHPEIAVFYSRFLELDGQISLATKVIDDLLEQQPKLPQAVARAARLHFELGHERRAVTLLEQVIEQDSTDSEARYRLALCQFRLAEAVSRGDPYLRVGVEQAARAAFLRSAESYRVYVRLKPTDVEGFLGEARARFHALVAVKAEAWSDSEIMQILSILSAGAVVNPKSPALAHNRALVYQHLAARPKAGTTLAADMRSRARSALEAALRLDEDFLPAILNLAHLLDADGDKAAARDLCRRALELNPSPSEAKRLRSYLESK